MKKFKYFLITAFLILTYALSFAGGQEEEAVPAGPVEIRFTIWSGSSAHLSMLNDIANKFTAENPNVNVKYDFIPFDDYIKKVTLQLAGSNPPDGGWLLETSAPTFVEAGVLADLRSKVEEYDYEDFSEPACALWVKGPAVYGVPFSTSPFIILYNKDLFRRAGVATPTELYEADNWTWEKFDEIAKVIKEKTGVYAFQSMEGKGYDVRVWHTLIPIMHAYGGDAWDAEGNCLFSTPESVKAVQFYHDMIFIDKSVVPPGVLDDFYAGNAATTIAQISRVPKLKDVTWEWDLAPLPSGPAGKVDLIGQAAVVAFRASRYTDRVADFVAFMTNKENVTTMAQFFPPARVSVMNSEAFLRSNPLIAPESMKLAVAGPLKRGKVLPSHVNFPKIDLIARGEFDNLWVEDANVKAVLEQVCQAISPLLK